MPPPRPRRPHACFNENLDPIASSWSILPFFIPFPRVPQPCPHLRLCPVSFYPRYCKHSTIDGWVSPLPAKQTSGQARGRDATGRVFLSRSCPSSGMTLSSSLKFVSRQIRLAPQILRSLSNHSDPRLIPGVPDSITPTSPKHIPARTKPTQGLRTSQMPMPALSEKCPHPWIT